VIQAKQQKCHLTNLSQRLKRKPKKEYQNKKRAA
jgi:hypothetical protein